jgi:glucose/arabinose dehydrogenase
MRAPRLLSVIALVVFSGSIPTSGNTTFKSAYHDYRVVPFVDALVQPWSIAFLPDGDVLITERPGRLRIVRQGKLLAQPVTGIPEVFATGQGGLLEVAPHPGFRTNRLLYLSYSKPQAGGQSTTALVRGRYEGDRLSNLEPLFESISRGRGHYGGKIAFDRNGFVFLTLGDRQVAPEGNLEAHPAQDLSNHHGKIIRLHDDGRVPADNPFVNRTGVRPETWSYGHRNVQGLAIHPESNEVWTHEHGPQGGDELNRIEPGKNYGWPVIGFGVNYRTGLAIHSGTHREQMEQPAHVWIPSIGTSGLMIYTGDRFPEWRGSFFVGGMVGQQLARLTMQGPRVANQETLVQQMGRIRDVRQGLDGLIYLVVEDREGKPSPVYRMEPVSR